MLIDIIVHDAWVICMSKIVHITFIIYVTWYRHEMAHRIAYAWGHLMKWVSVHGMDQHCIWCLMVDSIRWDNVQQGPTVV